LFPLPTKMSSFADAAAILLKLTHVQSLSILLLGVC